MYVFDIWSILDYKVREKLYLEREKDIYFKKRF